MPHGAERGVGSGPECNVGASLGERWRSLATCDPPVRLWLRGVDRASSVEELGISACQAMALGLGLCSLSA